MEFFDEIKVLAPIKADNLKALLEIKNLTTLCNSISSIIKNNHSDGVIYCVWGEFRINREVLKNGIRFSMPDCPNALMWSITSENSGKSIIIHCTINKTSHEEDFIYSINEFVRDWKKGIEHKVNYLG